MNVTNVLIPWMGIASFLHAAFKTLIQMQDIRMAHFHINHINHISGLSREFKYLRRHIPRFICNAYF